MEQSYYKSNKSNESNNSSNILQNLNMWTSEIQENNLQNLDNYISTTFALLRDKRLYGNASKYALPPSDMNELIPKIIATNNIIKNNNYEIQILQKENIAKLGAIIKGLSNGTFRGGVKHKKRTLKRSRSYRKRKHNKKRTLKYKNKKR